jgi:hypothetical protein
MLDAALEYAVGGWPVFALRPNSKAPLISRAEGGRGLHDATINQGVIVRWWGKHPNANIGIRTGDVFDVLDVDHPDGWGSLAQLVAKNRALETGPVALTLSGGAHYLFAPTGRGNSAGRRPGLDWRGANGYVVASPSVVNGVAYEWLDDQPEKLPAAPRWLLDAVTTPTTPAGRVPAPAAPADGVSRYLGLIGAVAAAPQGQRNTALHWAACRLADHARTGDVAAALDALHNAAVRAGLTETEVQATIRSAFKGR